MKVELRAIEDVTPYGRNPRKNDSAVAGVVRSIKEFGFRQPIVVDRKGVIIVGHTRWRAAVELGLKEVPVHVAHLTKQKARAYRIADNRTHEDSAWANDLLIQELLELREHEVDLLTTGFSEHQLDRLLASAIGTESDVFGADLPEEPESEVGEVYGLGPHRLMCGDATDPQHVARLLAGAEPHLMITDPPYGVGYWRNRATRPDGTVYGAAALGEVRNDDEADWVAAWDLFPGEVAYVWHAGTKAAEVAHGLRESGFEIRAQVVWVKQRLVIGRGHYHGQHEPCWYAVRKGGTGHWSGDRKQSTVWEITHASSETGHSTQKPVDAMRRPILNNSEPGELVYDPFLGSGTTMIAAEMTGRICFGMEIDPRYCDLVRRRFAEFTEDPEAAA